MRVTNLALLFLTGTQYASSFSSKAWVTPRAQVSSLQLSSASSEVSSQEEEERLKRKQALLQLLGGSNSDQSSSTVAYDRVLACPETKEPLQIITGSPIIEGGASGIKVSLRTSPEAEKTYQGRTDTFFNLLESQEQIEANGDDNERNLQSFLSDSAKDAVNSLRVFVPPPLRMAGAMAGLDENYIPMRDLFTSPAVSFAYERGWRQGFAAAGFPGADEEYKLVREFFEPVTVGQGNCVVVDMSCATGLFTRRLAKSGDYSRVIGCDYSASMLTEARRRIQADSDLKSNSKGTRLDLVRLDVANIPMQTDSVNALHAGAAMHCWPDIDSGLAEIYRVLKPGGRFFASTFLSEYFRIVKSAESENNVMSQSFQYFESTDVLKEMVLKAGFNEENVSIEVLGSACVIIRCEK